MFPAIGVVDYEDIVKQHRAKPEQQDFSDVSNQHRWVITIRLESFETIAILVAEHKDVFVQNIAQESEFESFVNRVCCDDHVAITLDDQRMASLRKRIELHDRDENREGSGHRKNDQQCLHCR